MGRKPNLPLLILGYGGLAVVIACGAIAANWSRCCTLFYEPVGQTQEKLETLELRRVFREWIPDFLPVPQSIVREVANQ